MDNGVKKEEKLQFLVTGGAGFIGSNLSNRLIESGHKITVVDNLSTGKKENLVLSENVRFIEGSVTDYELMYDLLSNETYDYVFHFAAVASVAESVIKPVETHQVNYESLLDLLELCKKFQSSLKRFLFPSSAAVYGDIEELPKREMSAVKPMTPYAVDKYAAERTTINYYQLYGLPTSVVRFFNVYGPNQNPGSPYSGVISILLDRFSRRLNGEEAIFNLYGDGEQTRDFVYIEDVVNAIFHIIKSSESLGEVYNIGSNREISLNQVINTLSDIFAFDLTVQTLEERKGDIRFSLADISKLNQLGFSPENNIQQGLTKLVDHLRQN